MAREVLHHAQTTGKPVTDALITYVMVGMVRAKRIRRDVQPATSTVRDIVWRLAPEWSVPLSRDTSWPTDIPLLD